MSRALVFNAQYRNGLAVIRSLGSKGIKITAADCERISTGFFSKYCSKILVYPDPAKQEKKFLECILKEIKNTKYDVILPLSDEVLLPLSKHKHLIEKYTKFPFQDYEKLKIGRDKLLSISEARKVGLRVPNTIHIKNPSDLNKITKFPVIIRPTESSGSRGLFKPLNKKELRKAYAILKKDYEKIILQEYIPWGGMTYDVQVIMDKNSYSLAVFVSNRLRTYPVTAGPNVVGEGVDYPAIRNDALKLLKHLKWYGPAQVEFRIHPETNQHFLMEINPRFWGSIFLGMISGVDFPYIAYKMAKGEKVKPVLKYKKGIKARWLFPGDLLHLLFNPKSFRQWILDFFDTNCKLYIPSWKDPMPLFGRLLAIIVYAFNPKKLENLLRLKSSKTT